MNKIFFSILVALSLIYGCSGGSDDSSGGTNPLDLGGASMSGQWEGTLNFENGETHRINFVGFVQEGANLSGVHDWLFNGDTIQTEDVSGTIANSNVTISAIYRVIDSTDLVEFAYDGTVDGDVYSGNIRFTNGAPNNPHTDVAGTFSFSRVGGNPQPNSQSMSGDWQGTLTYTNGVTEPAYFVGLVQNGMNITGAHELTDNGARVRTEDVTGTVTNANVTMSAFYGTRGSNVFLELVYTGTVDGGVYNGNLHVTGNTDAGGPIDQRGSFSFTRNQNRAAMEEQLDAEIDENQMTEIQAALIEILGIE